jgi:dynein heavy chain
MIWDRRVINTYVGEFLCLGAVNEDSFKLTASDLYTIPEGFPPLDLCKNFVETLPPQDPPEAFGQHSNADIASQIFNVGALLDSLMTVNATLILRSSTASGPPAAVRRLRRKRKLPRNAAWRYWRS